MYLLCDGNKRSEDLLIRFLRRFALFTFYNPGLLRWESHRVLLSPPPTENKRCRELDWVC